MKILVSGLVNIETTISVKGFPIDYSPIEYPFFGIDSAVSGVGYNIAKALTTLGDNVKFVSFLANDAEGERVLSQLECDGIDTDGISYRLKRTPVSAVLYDPQGRRRIYCDLKDIQEQSVDPDIVLESGKACAIAALCNINFNRDLIKAAKKLGITTATDVHVLGDIDDEYNRDFMENADILFLSDENIPREPKECVKALYERYHNRIIVVGMGEKGALLFEAKKTAFSLIPAYNSGKIVNTVGAGDALFSSFIHFFAKGFEPKAALERAVIFAGIKIGANGASLGFCTEDVVEKTAAK